MLTPPKFPLDQLKQAIPRLGAAVENVSIIAQSTIDASFLSCLAHINHASNILYKVREAKDNNARTSSIFSFLVVESCERKGTTDDYYNNALRNYSKNLDDIYRDKVKKLKWQKASAVRDKETFVPILPRQPLIVSTSPTVEAVKKAIIMGYPHHAIFSGEGATFFHGYANNKDNKLKTLGELSNFRDGFIAGDARAGDMTAAKIEEGEISRVKDYIAFSLHVGMQPIILKNMLSTREAEKQGFLGRCIIVSPDSLAGTRFKDGINYTATINQTKEFIEENITHLYSKINFINDDPEQGLAQSSYYIKDEDQKLYDKFYNHFEPYSNPTNPFGDGANFCSRRRDHILSIAATLQAFRDAMLRTSIMPSAQYPIHSDIFELSLRLTQYYHWHFINSVKRYINQEVDENIEIQEPTKLDIVTDKFLKYLKKALAKKNIDTTQPFPVNTALFLGISRLYVKKSNIETRLAILVNKGKLIQDKDTELFSFPAVETEEKVEIFPWFIFDDETPLKDEQEEELINVENIAPSITYNNNRDQIELIRSRINLVDYVGKHVTLKHDMGLCPFHTEKTPSFSVKEQYFKCFGCDAKGDIYDFISMHKNLSLADSFPQILAIAAAYIGIELENKQYSVTYKEDPGAIAERNKRWEKEKAETLAKYELEKEQSRLLAKSTYESGIYLDAPYLSNRCGCKVVTPPGFRFLRSYYHTEEKKNYPVMIAGLTRENNFVGVHITFLSKDGTKKADILPNKKLLGISKGAYIRLYYPIGSDTLVITEGIETGMSAWNILSKKYENLSCFAAGSAYNMKELNIPPNFTRIIIAADNGEVGMKQAEEAKAVFEKQKFIVSITYPPEKFSDFNDYEYFKNKQDNEK